MSEQYSEYLNQHCDLHEYKTSKKIWRRVDVSHEKCPELVGTYIKPLKIQNCRTMRLSFAGALQSIYFSSEIPEGKIKLTCGQFAKRVTCDKHLKLGMYVHKWSHYPSPHQQLYEYKCDRISWQEWELEGRVESIEFSLQGGITAYCGCPIYLRVSGNVGTLRVEKTLVMVMAWPEY
jgi:hypothetical protein